MSQTYQVNLERAVVSPVGAGKAKERILWRLRHRVGREAGCEGHCGGDVARNVVDAREGGGRRWGLR